jgi:hypothetical protein
MQTIVLDDHGLAWDGKSLALRSVSQREIPNFDLLAYLIDNHGFVTVTKIHPRSARIRMRLETASPTSIAAALYLIADMGLERIIVSHSDDTFIDRLFPNLSQAVAYIDQQVAAFQRQSSSSVISR